MVSLDREVSSRRILALALPAVGTGLLHHAFRPVDLFFVRSLGAEAQGALGSVTFVTILAYGFFTVVSAGAGPLVARATGARNPELRREIVGTALFAGLVLAVGFALVGGMAARPIAGVLGLHGRTATYAAEYVRVLFLTGAAMVFSPIVDAIFHAMGNTRTPMALQGSALVVNSISTAFFVGYMGWGVAGAALGSTLAQTISVAIGLVLLWRAVGLRLADLTYRAVLPRLLRIGLPMGVSVAMYALVYQAMLATSISPLGPAVNAGLGIGFNALESFSWPCFMGASVAASSLVGRLLGANRPDLAWKVVRRLTAPTVAVGVVIGAIFWFFGSFFVGLLAADDAVYREAVLYAMVLAWSQPFVALESMTEGVLAGAGDTRSVFVGTVPLNVLRVPLAWWLSAPMGMGPAGIWWAINLTTMAKAILKGGFVWGGRWARVEQMFGDGADEPLPIRGSDRPSPDRR